MSIISTPRRILLLTLLEDGPRDLQELIKLAPHIPTSMVIYDLEQMRARGIVVKKNDKYLITDKGIKILREVPSEFRNTWRGLSIFHRLLNALSLRSAWVYVYYINPSILLALSSPLLLLSLIMAYISRVKLVILFPYAGPVIPWYISPVSFIIYGSLSYVVSYKLKPIIIPLKEVSNIIISLTPVAISLSLASLVYYFMVHVTEQIIVPVYVISYIAPVLSLMMLSTLTALDTGVPFEHVAIIYLSILYIPSSIIYLTIVNL